jgi:hypothetical protein
MKTRRIWYDTEFLEDGRTIDLISFGAVRDDGREYYAVNREAPWGRVAEHPWLMANVVPSLPLNPAGARTTEIAPGHLTNSAAGVDLAHPDVKPYEQIAAEVCEFILGGLVPARADVELWAWYGAYDHVALAWLFGPMSQLPEGIPMYTNDLRQEAQRLGNPRMPEQADGLHNALADARHNKVRHDYLRAVAAA